MSTATTSSRARWWHPPAFSLFLGAVMFAAAWIGDDLRAAIFSFLVIAAVAALFALGGRFETIRLMRQPDERWSAIDLRATAISGMSVVTVVIGAFVVELARGQDGQPWSLIGAVGGVSYIVAIAFLRWRS